MNARKRLLISLIGFVGLVWGATALWWWALNGMSDPVATANALTSFTLMLAGFGAATFPWGES